jgi:Host cell surface-exposed lipoprotein
LKRIAAATVAVVCLLAATSAGAVTGQEKSAIRAAKNYLSISAFSKLGLIQQLSSSAGDGYPHKVAVAAVDSLKVNWNTEAVKAAKNYLKISAFSCSGLIQQLDSSAGDQYTVAQATYGAKKAGAC